MKKYLSIIFTVMLLAYLVVTLTAASGSDKDRRCTGMTLKVNDTSSSRFVTEEDLMIELDSLPARARGMLLTEINPAEIRRHLMSIDKIEDAEVLTYTDGRIEIRVTPIIPVARVFDGDRSYYINRSGKQVTANARYHKDVPIIRGDFSTMADTTFTALSIMPLVDYIYSDTTWSRFFTMIEVKSPDDIILVPNIREHVVNIGSVENIPDKLSRLHRFYTTVLSKRGYESYDTLSLKWNGQLVATRRKKLAPPKIDLTIEDEEAPDTTVMLAAENVAPGQALPGVETHNDRPIPKKVKTENP